MSTMTINGGFLNSYSHIASGKRINSAADDAAGLAIAKKMEREETGLRVGAENAQAGIGALNVADVALDGVTGYPPSTDRSRSGRSVYPRQSSTRSWIAVQAL